jgi:hypothetical protein
MEYDVDIISGSEFPLIAEFKATAQTFCTNGIGFT